MENPFLTPMIIVIGLYILSELLLFRFPSKSYVKYIPGLLGILGGAIFGYTQFTSLDELTEIITPIYLSFNLVILSLLVVVIMTMRKPWKKKVVEDTEEDSPLEIVPERKIDLEVDVEEAVSEEPASPKEELQGISEKDGNGEVDKPDTEKKNNDSEKNS